VTSSLFSFWSSFLQARATGVETDLTCRRLTQHPSAATSVVKPLNGRRGDH